MKKQFIIPNDFRVLYAGFEAPLTALNCGDKCAPYNEYSVPFCCDIHHAVPTAYDSEWDYLKANTDLWHPFGQQNKNVSQEDIIQLEAELPVNQVLIECLGHTRCQRDYRAVTCRAFPFYPYLTPDGEFLGLAYYWEYRDRCWVISNLDVVSSDYINQFVMTYERIFELLSQERDNFRYHADCVRRDFNRLRRRIVLLHRNGLFYKVNPSNEKMVQISPPGLPKFGVYKISSTLKFPEE